MVQPSPLRNSRSPLALDLYSDGGRSTRSNTRKIRRTIREEEDNDPYCDHGDDSSIASLTSATGSTDDDIIIEDHLVMMVTTKRKKAPTTTTTTTSKTTATATDTFIKSIERLSSEHRLSLTSMATALGLSRQSFYRRCEKYDVNIDDYTTQESKDTFLKSTDLEQRVLNNLSEWKDPDPSTNTNKNEQAKSERALHNALTVLNPDGKTFEICNDREVNERNKFKTEVLVSEEKTRGLSRVFAECGTELSEFGLYKLENVYPEATSDILTGEMKSIEISEFSTPGSPTFSVQLVASGGHIIKPEKLEPLLASRIAAAKSGKFGETTVITDNVKGQWYYKETGGKHRDFKFTHTIFHHGQKCFLLARVLEKINGGVFKFFRESDGKAFLIDIKKGEFLIMMAHAGLCHHNSEEGLYTIVTDFVLPYDAIRREREGGVDGKLEQMIRKFAKDIPQHL